VNGPGAAALLLAGELLEAATPGREGPGWIGDHIDPMAPGQVAAGPLDDGLLTGRAGVALALAAAGALPGADPRLTSLAVETMRRVVSADDPRREPGWLGGDLGIARAALTVSGLTGARGLGAAAAALAGRAVVALASGRGVPSHADLIDGTAGVLMAVLAAHLPRGAEPHRRRAAKVLVDALRASAVRDDWGARWPMVRTYPPVAGMAHGAAGIALALRAATACGLDDDGLVDEALTWEEGWYDRASGGWPDLRDDSPGGPAVAWCHGALGIGIAAAVRSRLGDDGEPTFRRAALAAAGAAPVVDGSDGTLCHGRCGLVELHLAAGQTWPGGGEHLRAARAAAEPLVTGVRPDGTSWMHGVRGGRTPEVLAGTSGVVLTLVRCVDPTLVPEVTHPGVPVLAA
jgi:lantibiotic modifying enzyme